MLENGEHHRCLMVDVSPRGARISGFQRSMVPGSTVVITWDQGRSIRTCRIAWCDGANAGVQFVGVPSDAIGRALRKVYSSL
jgi:hypothetical protein